MKKMKYTSLNESISFHDPESGFIFEKKEAEIVLSFHDWQNRLVKIIFSGVEKFNFSYFPPYPEIPEGDWYEILESEHIALLRQAQHIGQNERIHHYVISTNEDEWCEVVAEKYVVS